MLKNKRFEVRKKTVAERKKHVPIFKMSIFPLGPGIIICSGLQKQFLCIWYFLLSIFLFLQSIDASCSNASFRESNCRVQYPSRISVLFPVELATTRMWKIWIGITRMRQNRLAWYGICHLKCYGSKAYGASW